jgi:hypothetical protein
MSISEIVDAEYRIHASDLHKKESEWIVSNVSYQGVEDLAPVLHLHGITKRLVLNPLQSRQMMALTRSSIPEEWIGARIRLEVTSVADTATIAITAAEMPTRRRQWPLFARLHRPIPKLLFVIVCTAILIALASLAFHFGWTP